MPAPNYSIFEYRGMKEPISQEKGHTLKRNNKHYAGRNGVIRLIGLHIAVWTDDPILPDTSAENLNQYGATTTRQASWHVASDTDSICVGLPDSATAWVQGVSGYSFNSHGLGGEIATLQTNWKKIPQWRVYRFLRHHAAWVAPRVLKYKIPLKLLRNRNEVERLIRAGKPAGFAYHGDLDPGNRTDPGLVGSSRTDTFPIDWFFDLVRDEINIRLKYHGNVYKDTRFNYVPYKYGGRAMQIFCVGEDVLQWQKNLNKAGIRTQEDSSFGPGCEAATMKFQGKYGLEEDGAVGPATRQKMAEVLKKETKPVPTTPKPPVKIPVSRISGKDRFDTNAALVAQKGKGGAKKAYVVNAMEFNFDASSAASLGDGVLFASKPNGVPASVLKALKSYNPTSVVIVGGKTVLTDTVLWQVEDTFRE